MVRVLYFGGEYLLYFGKHFVLEGNTYWSKNGIEQEESLMFFTWDSQDHTYLQTPYLIDDIAENRGIKYFSKMGYGYSWNPGP